MFSVEVVFVVVILAWLAGGFILQRAAKTAAGTELEQFLNESYKEFYAKLKYFVYPFVIFLIIMYIN